MSETKGGGLLAAYRIGGNLARPILPLFLSWRARRGKEDPTRIRERQGEASLARPSGPLVWVHAASVGETNTVLPLIGRIAAAGPRVLLTTVTVTSAAIAATRLPKGAIHQFAPLDVAAWTARFLNHWRPDVALFAESELWPGLIAELATSRIPLALVNARLSESSYLRWRRLGRRGAAMLEPITLCLAQDAEYAERYRAVGLRQVTVTGNLKFDVPAPSADAAELAKLKAAIGGRPVWLAASTHEGEEAAAGAAHRELRRQFPGLLTIIVPRHPPRGPAVAQALAADGLKVALRSAGAGIAFDTDLYVADTLGELGLFYRLAPVAFVGGSLVPHGGQNPIEPVKLGAAVLHGPNVANFSEVYAALDAADGRARIGERGELAAAVAMLLADPKAREARSGAAAAALTPYSGALEATLQALKPFLDPLIPSSPRLALP